MPRIWPISGGALFRHQIVVTLASLYPLSSWSGGRRSVDTLVSEQCPGDAGCLIGHGDQHDVCRPPRQEPVGPARGEPLELPVTRQLTAILERRRTESEALTGDLRDWVFPSTLSASGHIANLSHLYERIGAAGGTKFWYHGLRNAFITVAERDLLLPRALTKRLVNHARPGDVTEGCGRGIRGTGGGIEDTAVSERHCGAGWARKANAGIRVNGAGSTGCVDGTRPPGPPGAWRCG